MMEITTLQGTGAAALAVAGLACIYWGGGRKRSHDKIERARGALASAGNLVQLIAQVQQHRGMSAAWRAGDTSFAARLPEKQGAVRRLFSSVLDAAKREDGERIPCFVTHDARVLRHEWERLVEGLADLTPEQSFHTHCRIVATLLDWLAAIGEARVEQPLSGTIPAVAARNFFHRLPVLVESLGQARALASAVAARRHCPPVSRVRLLFLLSRAESLMTQAQAPGAAAMTEVPAEARRAVATFVAALRDRLIASREIELSASECFTLGTSAIDAVFAWLAHEQRVLDAALAQGGTAGNSELAGGIAR
ncbi:nitrate- and nitrite sensing domain-containing protein [Azoarcus sp. KH32C]|uniref:nitrate- and nitrite sensing domain-containing protein n=1 Tax=Azoarcus sp. KH32C TaxID=748247 RepID=UPI00023867E8|nr:nitrate- and nitrite sensing domain-containing protein [Azoarcus sp. KH32C]BAL23178.1 hypothetical protein AZKH_0841 [Azoarcus sp. KH32C]